MADVSFFTRGQFWPPGIVVACVCVCVCINHLLVRTITSSPVQARITKFGPDKQNTLVKIPIVLGGNWQWPSRSNLTSNSKLTPFWACPNHYSPPILVRISKFGQQMHFSTVKTPVNSGLDWSWTSPSFLIPKLIFFSCDQAAPQMVFSVRPSVRTSVRLSHLFDYVPIIVSSWNFQELIPMTKVRSMQKVKVRGQRSRSQRSQPNLTVSGL